MEKCCWLVNFIFFFFFNDRNLILKEINNINQCSYLLIKVYLIILYTIYDPSTYIATYIYCGLIKQSFNNNEFYIDRNTVRKLSLRFQKLVTPTKLCIITVLVDRTASKFIIEGYF